MFKGLGVLLKIFFNFNERFKSNFMFNFLPRPQSNKLTLNFTTFMWSIHALDSRRYFIN